MTSFILFVIGLIFHIIQLVQNIGRSFGKKIKALKFKTIRFFSLTFYIIALCNFTFIVIIDLLSRSQISYMNLGIQLIVSPFAIILYYFVSLYFKWIHKKERDNTMMNLLLNATEENFDVN